MTTAKVAAQPRQLLVFGDKTFRITVPAEAKLTFGPFSPPTKGNAGYGGDDGRKAGTLRVYLGTKDNIIACFAGVHGFRDLTLDYSEQVAKEEGATIWKSDEHGYRREVKQSARNEWVDDPARALAAPSVRFSKRKAKP